MAQLDNSTAWSTTYLTDLASAIDGEGKAIDDCAANAKGQIDSLLLTWEGVDANATSERVATDLGAMGKVAMAMEDLATALRNQEPLLSSAVSRARTTITDLRDDGYVVDDNGIRVPEGAGGSGNNESGVDPLTAGLPEAARRLRDDLNAVDSTDREVAIAIARALETMTTSLPTAIGLDAAVGTTDGQALTDGAITLEDRMRLREHLAALGLTPQHLSDLSNGVPVTGLTPGALDYMTALTARLGGHGLAAVIGELGASMDPTEAQTSKDLANAVMLISNENLSGPGGERGGLDRLPPEVRDMLSLPAHSLAAGVMGNEAATTRWLSENKDRWDLARDLLPALRGASVPPGHDFALGLSTLSANALTAPTVDPTLHGGFEISNAERERVAGDAIRNFSANHVAAAEVLESRPGTVAAILRHQWTSDPNAPGALVDWIGAHSHVGPGVDDAAAKTAGRAAKALFLHLGTGEHMDRYLGIGTLNSPIGETNPQLARSISATVAQYVDILGGSGVPPGMHFGTDDSPGIFGSDKPDAARRIFAILGSDREAGAILNASALLRANSLDGLAAVQSLTPSDQNYSVSNCAGQLRGLVEGGRNELYDAWVREDRVNESIAAAERAASYDSIKTLIKDSVSAIPVASGVGKVLIGAAATGFDVGATMSKDTLLNSIDTAHAGLDPHSTDRSATPSSGNVAHQVQSVQALIDSGHLPQQRVAELGILGPDGRMLPPAPTNEQDAAVPTGKMTVSEYSSKLANLLDSA